MFAISFNAQDRHIKSFLEGRRNSSFLALLNEWHLEDFRQNFYASYLK